MPAGSINLSQREQALPELLPDPDYILELGLAKTLRKLETLEPTGMRLIM